MILSTRVRRRVLHARRGSALILVLLMTLAVAALAIAAIFMTSSAGLLSRFYDKERLYRLAGESALELTRSRLLTDSSLVVADTGMTQLLSGWTPTDASGAAIGGVAVNVYAAATGDTTGLWFPHVTLIASSYDANGTRHVRRMDLRRESFSRYQYLVDSFPSGNSHGPGVVAGRVHSNGNWINSASGNRFYDTVSVVGAVSGAATFDIDSLVGVVRIPYPKDSTFLRLDTLALNAGLRFAPVSGSGRGSRMEFVAFDADNDGTVEESEGFFKVFDIAAGRDTSYLRVSPPEFLGFFGFGASSAPSGGNYLSWSDPRIQNQCGAFYLRGGRWHFFPISTHRRTWAAAIIGSNNPGDVPGVGPGMMNRIDDYDFEAAEEILQLPTARCFPAGSPFLMPAERFTNGLGVVTGGPTDLTPWGQVAPAGGWPLSAPLGYGGSDTTFTIRSQTCELTADGPSLTACSSGAAPDSLGRWRLGTNPGGISASVRQPIETQYLWAYGSSNTLSRGVISVTGSPLFLSGTIRGRVTLRAEGRVMMIDKLRYNTDPNGDATSACDDMLGILAVGDVLVVNGLLNRVRRIKRSVGTSNFSLSGGEGRFFANGTLMSLTGTVGVEGSGTTMGASVGQLECPENAGSSTRSNGGCFALTGGAIMKRYSSLYSGTETGMRYQGAPDRCQSTTRRPPFFPLTNRYVRIRTLEVEPSTANSPAKIRALLMLLKGKAL